MRREYSGRNGLPYVVRLGEGGGHIRRPLGEHGFDERHPASALDLTPQIEDFFRVFWAPEEARALQPEVDDTPDPTLDAATAEREPFRPPLSIVHAALVRGKVVEGGANRLVLVVALVQCLKGRQDGADVAVFQQGAHVLEPLLLLLGLPERCFRRWHEFLDRKSVV